MVARLCLDVRTTSCRPLAERQLPSEQKAAGEGYEAGEEVGGIVRIRNSAQNAGLSPGIGSRIRVHLYNGKVVEAEITVITNQSTGRKLQIVYGNVTASINPAQITEVFPAT